MISLGRCSVTRGRRSSFSERRWVPNNATAQRNLKSAKAELEAKGISLGKTTLVDVFASSRFTNWKCNGCPCIAASRGKSGGFYITTLKRMTSYEELGRLQGFPTDIVRSLLDLAKVSAPGRQRLTPNLVGHAIGNAISVNMLMRLLPRILVAAGLATPETLRLDPWKPLTRSMLKSFQVMPDDLYNADKRASASAAGRLAQGSVDNGNVDDDDYRGEVSVTDIE